MTVGSKGQTTFSKKDMAEIAVGACAMGFPVAMTEEVWNLGAELSLMRTLIFAMVSVSVLGAVVLLLQHRFGEPIDHEVFFRRVLSTYGLTLLIAAFLLFGVDRIDLVGEPAVSLKRVILVAFPASFAATAVDSLGA